MTIHQSERQWGGKGPGGKGGFKSRTDGYNFARHSWVCRKCLARREAEQRVGNPGEAKRLESRPRKPLRCVCGHGEFWHCDSVGEARRLVALVTSAMQGGITELKIQPKFMLTAHGPDGAPRPVLTKGGRRMVYEADFSYLDRDGQLVVEDWKPRAEEGLDPLFRLKRQFVEAQYDLRITIRTKLEE